MNLLDRAGLLAHILRWRLTWNRRDTSYLPPETLPDKFKSARAAGDLIPDAACVISCGISGNARCSIFFWAIRERFQASGFPKKLTWISVGGQGGRGRVPGTVEEIGLDGLVSCYITGHTETAKSLLRLADANRLELHTLPQGEMTHVIEAQARGEQDGRRELSGCRRAEDGGGDLRQGPVSIPNKQRKSDGGQPTPGNR